MVIWGLAGVGGALLIPLAALVAAYLSIAGERESGSIKFALSLPISRGDLVLGKTLLGVHLQVFQDLFGGLGMECPVFLRHNVASRYLIRFLSIEGMTGLVPEAYTYAIRWPQSMVRNHTEAETRPASRNGAGMGPVEALPSASFHALLRWTRSRLIAPAPISPKKKA
jgi:hypothetical protein